MEESPRTGPCVGFQRPESGTLRSCEATNQLQCEDVTPAPPSLSKQTCTMIGVEQGLGNQSSSFSVPGALAFSSPLRSEARINAVPQGTNANEPTHHKGSSAQPQLFKVASNTGCSWIFGHKQQTATSNDSLIRNGGNAFLASHARHDFCIGVDSSSAVASTTAASLSIQQQNAAVSQLFSTSSAGLAFTDAAPPVSRPFTSRSRPTTSRGRSPLSPPSRGRKAPNPQTVSCTLPGAIPSTRTGTLRRNRSLGLPTNQVQRHQRAAELAARQAFLSASIDNWHTQETLLLLQGRSASGNSALAQPSSYGEVFKARDPPPGAMPAYPRFGGLEEQLSDSALALNALLGRDLGSRCWSLDRFGGGLGEAREGPPGCNSQYQMPQPHSLSAAFAVRPQLGSDPMALDTPWGSREPGGSRLESHISYEQHLHTGGSRPKSHMSFEALLRTSGSRPVSHMIYELYLRAGGEGLAALNPLTGGLGSCSQAPGGMVELLEGNHEFDIVNGQAVSLRANGQAASLCSPRMGRLDPSQCTRSPSWTSSPAGVPPSTASSREQGVAGKRGSQSMEPDPALDRPHTRSQRVRIQLRGRPSSSGSSSSDDDSLPDLIPAAPRGMLREGLLPDAPLSDVHVPLLPASAGAPGGASWALPLSSGRTQKQATAQSEGRDRTVAQVVDLAVGMAMNQLGIARKMEEKKGWRSEYLLGGDLDLDMQLRVLQNQMLPSFTFDEVSIRALRSAEDTTREQMALEYLLYYQLDIAKKQMQRLEELHTYFVSHIRASARSLAPTIPGNPLEHTEVGRFLKMCVDEKISCLKRVLVCLFRRECTEIMNCIQAVVDTGAKRRTNLPKFAVATMRLWLFRNFQYPYPAEPEKTAMALKTGITIPQVNNWFINARVRIWRPIVNTIMPEHSSSGGDTNSSSDDLLCREDSLDDDDGGIGAVVARARQPLPATRPLVNGGAGDPQRKRGSRGVTSSGHACQDESMGSPLPVRKSGGGDHRRGRKGIGKGNCVRNHEQGVGASLMWVASPSEAAVAGQEGPDQSGASATACAGVVGKSAGAEQLEGPDEGKGGDGGAAMEVSDGSEQEGEGERPASGGVGRDQGVQGGARENPVAQDLVAPQAPVVALTGLPTEPDHKNDDRGGEMLRNCNKDSFPITIPGLPDRALPANDGVKAIQPSPQEGSHVHYWAGLGSAGMAGAGGGFNSLVETIAARTALMGSTSFLEGHDTDAPMGNLGRPIGEFVGNGLGLTVTLAKTTTDPEQTPMDATKSLISRMLHGA